MAKKARVWTGTEFVELASAQTDLTAYSTTAQMNTAITAGVGLVPILTQTIGTAVTSVTVSNVFSATYDNYKIIISGGVGSTASWITLKLGATTTGYYWAQSAYTYGNSAGSTGAANQSTFARFGYFTTDTINANLELVNPFNAKHTILSYFWNIPTVTGEAGSGGGYLPNTTSYTDFTVAPQSGTLTGGTIRVYGYKN